MHVSMMHNRLLRLQRCVFEVVKHGAIFVSPASATARRRELIFSPAASAATRLISRRTVLSRMTRLIIPPRSKKSSLSPTVSTGRSFTAARISSTLRFSLPLTNSNRHCRQAHSPSQCSRTTVRPSIVLDFTSDERAFRTDPCRRGQFVTARSCPTPSRAATRRTLRKFNRKTAFASHSEAAAGCWASTGREDQHAAASNASSHTWRMSESNASPRRSLPRHAGRADGCECNHVICSDAQTKRLRSTRWAEMRLTQSPPDANSSWNVTYRNARATQATCAEGATAPLAANSTNGPASAG